MTEETAVTKSRRQRLRRRARDPLEFMRRNMRDVFADRLEDFGPLWFSDDSDNQFRAELDVGETKDDITVTVDVPGMDQKDIDVSLSDNALLIKGEREEQDEEKRDNYYRAERRYGAFERRVPLPCEVEAQDVKADLHNGVLTITLPKSAQSKESELKVEITAH